jgi:hypothetical protein
LTLSLLLSFIVIALLAIVKVFAIYCSEEQYQEKVITIERATQKQIQKMKQRD